MDYLKKTKFEIDEIADLLDRGNFINFYQPIHQTLDEKVMGFEALSRICFLGHVYDPSYFLSSLIKINFLNYKLSYKVIEQATLYSQKTNMPISINLTIDLFFNKKIIDLLKKSAKNNAKINVEILEFSDFSNVDFELVITIINELQACNINVYLDDFGTGANNIIYLHLLPISLVKVDKKIFQHALVNKSKKIIFEGTIKIIKDLGIKILVEGVETEKEYEYLKTLDIEYFQGFYKSKPMPESEATKFINQA